MSTLKREQNLLFDPRLAKLLSAARNKAPRRAWEEAVIALNLRSMPHLAADLARRALKLYPTSSTLWRERILSEALYIDALQEAFNQLHNSRKAPPNRETLLALIDYYLERDKDGISRLENVPKEKRDALHFEVIGHYAVSAEKYKEAARAYSQALRLAPKDVRLYYHLGETLRLLGRGAEARARLLMAVRRERHFVQAWNALCRLQLDSGEIDQAHQSLGMALSINPRDWGVYFTFADYHLSRQEYGRARSVLNEILDLEPRTLIAAEVHNYLGYVRYLEGDYARAMPCFEKALEINPYLAVAWLNIGNIHFHLKRYDEAVSAYEKALKIDPQLASAYTQIGLCHLEMGQLDLARRPLEAALAIDASEYFAHLGLSEFHRRTRNPIGALDEARQAFRIEPKDPNVHNALGIALECNRRYFDAEKAYRRALAIDARHRWAANNLGYLCEKLMRMDDAYRQQAVEAWRTRLLICRDTGASMRGAINHLQRLGISAAAIKQWIQEAPPQLQSASS
jgi:tetratricopeptide (TPR) repeat protein